MPLVPGDLTHVPFNEAIDINYLIRLLQGYLTDNINIRVRQFYAVGESAFPSFLRLEVPVIAVCPVATTFS